MKTIKAKKYYVKELKDTDTSKEYDASKSLNLSQLISASKRKKAKANAVK